jgi:sirohydrochlorin ferrochelatase
MLKRCYCIVFAAALVAVSIAPVLGSEALTKPDRNDSPTGFLVLAPDRGFAGDEEIRDAFEIFAEEHNASLVFVTDERTRKYLRAGLDKLINNGARRIVVIPLFISAAYPRYQLARELLERESVTVPVSHASPYGESFFAIEDLADKFRHVPDPAASNLIVVGYGAVDNDSNQKMHSDWKRIADRAAAGFGFLSNKVMIVWDREDEELESRIATLKRELADMIARDGRRGDTVVVPFHFGPKLDSLMSLDTLLKRLMPPDVRLIQNGSSDAQDIKSLSIWLQREANRNQPVAKEDVGVVFLSHGSDFNWNESMREAVQPLMKDYKIEFVFSMADQPTIERAIRKLEQRGAKAAIILRVFALEQSFRSAIERMVGLDIERTAAAVEAGGSYRHGHRQVHGHGHGSFLARLFGGYGHFHGHGHGHGGAAASAPPSRIRTTLPIQTVGGIDSSPLFAEALLNRARALSKNPGRDTVILVAHGSGDDHLNEQWQTTLEAVAEHMQRHAQGGWERISRYPCGDLA